jgi:hypothetical protein
VVVDRLFWLHASADRRPSITLHAEGCGALRLVKVRRGKTGPLSWDQLALLPVTYHVCEACRPGSPVAMSGMGSPTASATAPIRTAPAQVARAAGRESRKV